MPKLTIGYSTLAERAANIRPPEFDCELLVLVQGEHALRPEQFGPRARLDSVAGLGVAKSRNRAIELAGSEYLIFGDDDISFDPAALAEAIALMDANPQITLLLLGATDDAGGSRKRYPPTRKRLTVLNSARAATYEMLVRVEDVRRLGVRFDENFGAGVANYLGDEYIFISDLIRRGARCEFAPIFVARHPVESSGSRWGTDRDRRARAAVFTRVFGPLAAAVRLAFALRHRRELGGAKNLLLFVLGR